MLGGIGAERGRRKMRFDAARRPFGGGDGIGKFSRPGRAPQREGAGKRNIHNPRPSVQIKALKTRNFIGCLKGAIERHLGE